MNTKVTVRVPAKVNLCLGVGSRRPDGYHPLATVYQAVNLHDEVTVRPREDGRLTVAVHSEIDLLEDNAILSGPDNIAVRAARMLRDALERPELGADISIRKVIPVAGGMAGGSADAAATLVACNELWGGHFTRDSMETLAAELGSDVPFLLHGGIALGGGRGELVNPILSGGRHHWVFATSATGLSTAAVYQEFDRLNTHGVAEPRVPDDLISVLRDGDSRELGPLLSNDLSEASLSLRPDLSRTIDVGLDAGALGGIISGSGPTVMFLVESEHHGVDIARALSRGADCADVIPSWGPVPGARII